MSDLITFLQKSFTVGNIKDFLTVLGGALGFFSFYFQFLRKFQPHFSISKKIVFKLGNKPSSHQMRPLEFEVQSIFIHFCINNPRNIIGTIEDMMIRVYDAHSLLPEPSIFYFDGVGSSYENTKELASITILPKSSIELGVNFKPDIVGRKIFDFETEKYLMAEIFYKLPKKRGWKKLEKQHLYNSRGEKEMREESLTHFEFNTFNRETSRKDGLKKLSLPKSSVYHGWWDRWFESFKFKVMRYVLWPFRSVANTYALIKIWTIRALDYLFVLLIKKPLVYKNSSASLSVNFKMRENHISVEKFFQDLHGSLKELITQINKDISDDLKKLKIDPIINKEFRISGKRGAVKAYMTGADTIYIIDEGKRKKVINFCLKRCEFFWGGHYFVLNGRPVFLKTASFNIYDAISLHLK